MAFQKRIELDNGIVLENAYVKIASMFYYNRLNETSYAEINVNIYKDQQARLDGKPEVTKFTHKCTDASFTSHFSIPILNAEGVNAVSQAYAWMKTMTLYSGAVDIQDAKE